MVSISSERPVSSVGRAWDSYMANQQCSSNPRVVGSSPTSGAAFLASLRRRIPFVILAIQTADFHLVTSLEQHHAYYLNSTKRTTCLHPLINPIRLGLCKPNSNSNVALEGRGVNIAILGHRYTFFS